MESFGERIRRLRRKKGISQRALAKAVNVSPGLISFVERDKNRPSIDVVFRMAKFFGTTTDYLIAGKELGENARSTAVANQIIEQLKKDKSFSFIRNLYTEISTEKLKLLEQYQFFDMLKRISTFNLKVLLKIMKSIA
ncbi:helix-turn-helix transcriptional regulator [bacterium]|nr:helix-turn-helix transcriptional regulator [bacterium]